MTLATSALLAMPHPNPMGQESTQSTGRHVIISGGSRGLGRALVEGLLHSGYRVSTFSRQRNEFVNQIGNNPDFLYDQVDLSDGPSVSRFLEAAKHRFGPPHGLVNCAGAAVVGVLAVMHDDLIDRAITTNLRGALILTRQVVRQMRMSRVGGSIINISSVVGLRGYRGMAVYGATKAGMDAMTRALARELGGWSIRVNSVAPGYLRTQMTSSLKQNQLQKILRRTPLQRLGTPEDVVGPVRFLLSDESAFVTGQVLVVDGGITV
jgi:3-oxoacyl-[acyl-carrier protein] reductase